MRNFFVFVWFLALTSAPTLAGDRISDSIRSYDRWARGRGFEEKKQALFVIIQLAEKQNDPDGKANALRRLGSAYSHEGELDSALTSFLTSLRIQEQSGNKEGYASTLNNLGVLYYEMGQTYRALTVCLEMNELAEEINSPRLNEVATTNIAQFYFELDSLEKATYYLAEARQWAKQLGTEGGEGFFTNLEGLIEMNGGNLIKAHELFAAAEELFRKESNNYGAAQAMHNQGLALKKQGKQDEAMRRLKSALDSALNTGEAKLIGEIAQDIQQYCLEIGDTLQAYHYLNLSKQFQDSLLNEAGIKSLIETEQKYQNEAKTRELTLQKQELRQRYLLILLLSALLVLGLLGFYFFRKAALHKQRLVKAELEKKSLEIDEMLNRQEIASLNAQMQGQNEERERISRDLHDRLGSLLSTIKMQFSHFEGKLGELEQQFRDNYHGMLGLLDNAYGEVRKISHDLSSGTVQKFGLKKAVDELIVAIAAVNPIHIEFIDNRTDPVLYEYMSEPLYRVVQELLSNTLKHARASEVTIQLRAAEGILYFSYEDNGVGLKKDRLALSEGIGMKNIAARVQMLNGTYTVDSTPGHGFTLMIEIPL